MKIQPNLSLQSVLRMGPAGARSIGPVPAASLDFALGQYRLGGSAVARGAVLGLTRASAALAVDASGVLVSSPANVPRFDHDPLTGAARGLLVETQRTNQLTKAQETDLASWVLIRVAASVAGIAAPDGVSGVALLTSEAVSDARAQKYVSGLAGPQTLSVWVRPALGTAGASIGWHNGGGGNMVWARFAAGVLGETNADAAKIEPWPGGWYRISMTATPADTNPYLFMTPWNGVPGGGFGTRNAGDAVSLWGPQLEGGSSASSYIATGNSAVTRAADQPGLLGVSGSHDVALTYDDMSTETLPAQAISPGWWPALARPRLRRMVVV